MAVIRASSHPNQGLKTGIVGLIVSPTAGREVGDVVQRCWQEKTYTTSMTLISVAGSCGCRWDIKKGTVATVTGIPRKSLGIPRSINAVNLENMFGQIKTNSGDR